MYQVREITMDEFCSYERHGLKQTIFQTSMWLEFLKKNQHIKPVVLELSVKDVCALFVGGIIKKCGFKILGSPFEGWLTPDMGFIRIAKIDCNEAVKAVSDYAFKTLKCHMVQITDKEISTADLDKSIKYTTDKLLRIDIDKPEDNILEGFKKNGRRDVRAAQRKGAEFVQVPFDEEFAENYYNQLIDVFAKQNLKPFYTKEKLMDLADTLEYYPERVYAAEARLENGECIATVFTLGYQEWAYFTGAASYREYQKYLPNEGLFWEFAKHWSENGIKNLDLSGYREYKLKYNPEIIEVPVIQTEKYPGVIFLKNSAKKCVEILRDFKKALKF